MRTEYKIFISSVIFGILVWVGDSLSDNLFFYEGSFLNLLILDVPAHEIYFRSQVIVFFAIFGAIISWLFAKRKEAEAALRRAHDQLEDQVEERTAKLSKANEELSRQIIERKKTESALRESQKELKLLTMQLLSAEENERKRFTRELHDGIGQELSAIKFSAEKSLSTLRKYTSEADLKAIEAIVPLAQKVIENVRRIVKEVRPSTLDVIGILATISSAVEEFQTIHSGIRIKENISVKENEITDSLKTVIFRILQEALNNIADHSRADSVRVCLKTSEGRICLIIEDNGVGFDVQQAMSSKSSKRGFGLASMRERTELSNGTFAVESANGKGTVLTASWPL